MDFSQNFTSSILCERSLLIYNNKDLYEKWVSVTNENNDLKSYLRAQENDNIALRKEYDKLIEEHMKIISKPSNQIHELTDENEKLQNVIKEMKDENVKLNATLNKKIQSYKKDIKELKNKLQVETNKTKSLSLEINKINHTNSIQQDKYKIENKKLKRELKKSNATMRKNQEKFISDMEKMTLEHSKSISDIQQQMLKCKKENYIRTETIKNAIKQRNLLQKEVKKQVKKYKELKLHHDLQIQAHDKGIEKMMIDIHNTNLEFFKIIFSLLDDYNVENPRDYYYKIAEVNFRKHLFIIHQEQKDKTYFDKLFEMSAMYIKDGDRNHEENIKIIQENVAEYTKLSPDSFNRIYQMMKTNGSLLSIEKLPNKKEYYRTLKRTLLFKRELQKTINNKNLNTNIAKIYKENPDLFTLEIK